MSRDTATFYRASDADPSGLHGQTVAVIGYGNLGRSVAMNLRDSGVTVTIGNIEDQCYTDAARDGFAVHSIADAVAVADVVFVLLADEVIPGCYRSSIEPYLRHGSALCFASGYVLAYDLISPSAEVDVLMIAPRMLAEEVRRTFQSGQGYVSYVSVEQDATGRAEDRLLALSSAMGTLQRGALRLSAQQEALLDLFVEQAFGSLLGLSVQLSFELGVQAGLPPDAMVLEMYMSGEMSRTLQVFADHGFYKSVPHHGMVAMYGGYMGTLEFDAQSIEQAFRTTLENIRSGGFARQFQKEQADGYPTLGAIQEITETPSELAKAEERVWAALAHVGKTA
jgi:ketol-acid reductoisomerase